MSVYQKDRLWNNWGLEDPTGKSDEEFKKVIDEIMDANFYIETTIG